MIVLRRKLRLNMMRNMSADRGSNGWAGTPTMEFLGAHVEIRVGIAGEPSSLSGFVCSVTEIDEAVRCAGMPLVREAIFCGNPAMPHTLLSRLRQQIESKLGRSVTDLSISPSPYLQFAITSRSQSVVFLTQQFEFAASHRLNSPTLSPTANQELYGKCNNVCGHGHNYRLDVQVALPSDRPAPTLLALESLVQREILARFDHQNLDLTPDFEGGISSVENIAARCFELLAPGVTQLGGALNSVTVWETDKTSATATVG